MTFQAWKMVFLNAMTFRDQGAPWQNTVGRNELAPTNCRDKQKREKTT